MNAHIVSQPWAQRVVIYLTRNNQYLKQDEGWIPYDVGAEPEPFIIIDYYIWDAIMKEALGTRTVEDDVLRDTRQIRDRLLTMLETEWQSRQLEKK